MLLKNLKSYALFESGIRGEADLLADYDMLNDKLFDGKLQNVRLRWMRTKYKLGVMAYNDKREIEYVGVSTMYKLTRQQYLNVLAHEMIHAYMEQQGILERDPHGRKFMSILNDLNRKHPEFQIAKSENASDFNVRDTGAAKTYLVVLFDIDGEISIVAAQEKAGTPEAIEGFVKWMKDIAPSTWPRNKSIKLEIYKSAHPDIPKFQIKKSLSTKSLKIYVLDENMANEIRTDELIGEYKIK